MAMSEMVAPASQGSTRSVSRMKKLGLARVENFSIAQHVFRGIGGT
jgi:hypothetical protein